MKIKFILFLTMLGTLQLMSCKKEKKGKNNYTISYQIAPMNVSFTTIRYTGSSGQSVEILDPSKFTTGEVSFNKPAGNFIAKLYFSSYNNTSNALHFSIVIDSGQHNVAYKSVIISPYQHFSDSLEYSFQ